MTPIVGTGEGIAELTRLLAGARNVLVFTGAGISTASGIPDYRGPQGVWKTDTPVLYQDFLRSPDERLRYWRQKIAGRRSFGAAEPNAVHHAIVRLERAGRIEAVVTQNVDGLHRLAGTSEDRLVELHGTTTQVTCTSCGASQDADPVYDGFEATGEPPRCHCGGYLKPATISFGQMLVQDDIERALAAAALCDAVISLGSTLAVSPAEGIPRTAASRGIPYAIVNRGPTEHDHLSSVSLRIDGDVGEIVPAAVERAVAGA